MRHIDDKRWGIEAVDGVPYANLDHWPAADGDVINRRRASSGAGIVEIRNVLMNQVLTLDFRNVSKPVRTEPAMSAMSCALALVALGVAVNAGPRW